MKISFFSQLMIAALCSTLIACSGGSEGNSPGGNPKPPSGNDDQGSTGGNTGGNGGSTGGTTGSTTGGTSGGTSGGTTGSTTGGTTGGNQPCTPNAGVVYPGTIVINNGAAATKNSQVNLTLAREEATQMKITNDSNCGCGTWEPYSASKIATLTKLNQTSHLSVQFKDYDNATSLCASASILHDDLAPAITLTLDPANTYRGGENTKVNFKILDAGVGVDSYTCKLNGVSTSCALNSGSSEGSKVFSAQAQGNYTLSVTATDKLGTSETQSVSWTVTNPLRNITQNYSVTTNDKVDVLIVIDNSGSMAYEQQSMAQRMGTFVNNLTGLNWKVGITTTDPGNSTYGDGRLVKMKGLNNVYEITSAMNPTQAQTILGNTIQRSETGSGSEQGIYVTYRAIERALASGSSANKSFFRNDAAFATIVISDENESANGTKNQPTNLNNFVKNTWPTKAFAFHSIIVKPGDTACLANQDHVYGTKYKEMSDLTGAGTIGGAIVGSVCATDYASQLTGIADSIQQMHKVITLQCEPVGNPTSSVVVRHNGTNYTGGYEVQGLRLIFANSLPAGSYELSYQCL